MNYTKFDKVYLENKKLDKMFNDYFQDQEMFKKNKLELLVEIGELANETRYFKYWSNKKMNVELVKGEFADCIIMCLTFFNFLGVNLNDSFPIINEIYDKTDIFAKLYEIASDFYKSNSQSLIKEFFVILIKLGHMIGFTDEDIKSMCLDKIKRNQERFMEGF